MAKNRVKFDIELPMDEEIDTKEKSILKDNGIKMPVFAYKGEIETDRNDITQKKVEDKFKRSARMLYATAAMHITDAIKANKLTGKSKDRAPVTAAAKAIDAGCDKVARKMTKLMDEIVKAYGSNDKSEEPGFENLGQIERYVTGLAEIDNLADASKELKESIIAICKGPPEKMVDDLAKAYTAYGRRAAKGIAITEGVARIPKVDATGADGKAITNSKVDTDTDKDVARQVNEMKETAELLKGLPKPLTALHVRVELIRTGYEALQTQAKRGVVGAADGSRFPMIGAHDVDPVMGARARVLWLLKDLKKELRK